MVDYSKTSQKLNGGLQQNKLKIKWWITANKSKLNGGLQQSKYFLRMTLNVNNSALYV
jgi:hypothetical protein